MQFTSILAGALTVVTCVLWTIPVSLVATLTKVEEIKKEIPFLREASERSNLPKTTPPPPICLPHPRPPRRS